MAQPPAYNRSHEFAEAERDNEGGRSTVRTADVDAELDAVATSINAIRTNIALNQRDDGEIRDGRVKLFTLASDVLALLGTAGTQPRGAWVTATLYNVKDVVTESGRTYLCAEQHTSGVFATDLAAFKWLLISLSANPAASGIPFTTTATIAATNVQAALEESDSENRALSAAAQATANAAVPTANLANTANAALGDALQGVKKVGITGAQATTQHIVNEERWVDVVADFAADKTGVSDASTAIQNAINSGAKRIRLGDGTFLIDADITVGDDVTIDLRGATLKASANNRIFFKSTTHAYYTQFWGGLFDGNGKTGVVAFDLTNFRLRAGIYGSLLRDLATGIIARTGCFGSEFVNIATERVPAPIQVLANGSVLRVENPSFDNTVSIGGTGLGIGVDVRAGAGSNIGCIVNDGFIQGFDKGVLDAGIGTKVRGTYFEVCATADISGEAARGSEYSGIQHFGPSGAAGVRLRNSDAVTIVNPLMASGARTALYDIDSTNTNCIEYRAESNASYNTPTGSLTYLGSMAKETSGTFTPVIAGSATAGVGTYTTQSGTWRRIGSQVHAAIDLVWTAHTGTGNILITGIPAALAPASFTPRRIGQVTLVGITATGPYLYVYLNGTSTNLSLVEVSTAGVEALIAMDATGSLRADIVFDL